MERGIPLHTRGVSLNMPHIGARAIEIGNCLEERKTEEACLPYITWQLVSLGAYTLISH